MLKSILIRAKVCGWVPGGVTFLCQGPSAGVTDSSASSGCGSGPASNWNEVRAKVEAQVATWLRKGVILKGQGAGYIFTLILYRLSVLLLPLQWRFNDPFSNYFGKAEARWSVDRSATNVLEMGFWGLPDLENQWLTERLVYLVMSRDSVWGQKLRDAFSRLESRPKPKVVVSLGVKRRSPASAVRLSVTFLCPEIFLGHKKKTVSGMSGGFRFRSSCGVARLVTGRDSLSMELGSRLELLEQLRVLAHQAACPKRVGPQGLDFQNVLGRHARPSPLWQ